MPESDPTSIDRRPGPVGEGPSGLYAPQPAAVNCECLLTSLLGEGKYHMPDYVGWAPAILRTPKLQREEVSPYGNLARELRENQGWLQRREPTERGRCFYVRTQEGKRLCIRGIVGEDALHKMI